MVFELRIVAGSVTASRLVVSLYRPYYSGRRDTTCCVLGRAFSAGEFVKALAIVESPAFQLERLSTLWTADEVRAGLAAWSEAAKVVRFPASTFTVGIVNARFVSGFGPLWFRSMDVHSRKARRWSRFKIVFRVHVKLRSSGGPATPSSLDLFAISAAAIAGKFIFQPAMSTIFSSAMCHAPFCTRS